MEKSQSIQILGLILGWIIVHVLSSRRDIDKARREMIAKAADGLNDDVAKIFAVAKDYHTKERDVSSEDSLKMSLQDVSIRTTLLGRACSDEIELKACSRAILELKKSITGEHFEDEHIVPLPTNANQVKTIVDCVLRAKRAFQELKLKQFPPR